MLYHLIATSSAGHRILEWIEYAALVIEILAVVIIVGAIFYGEFDGRRRKRVLVKIIGE